LHLCENVVDCAALALETRLDSDIVFLVAEIQLGVRIGVPRFDDATRRSYFRRCTNTVLEHCLGRQNVLRALSPLA
jgi:hypothetical protein